MKKLLTTIVLVGIALPGVAKSQDRQGPGGGSQDAKELQGEWQQVDLQMNGNSVRRLVEAMMTNRRIFQGDALIDCNFASDTSIDLRGDSRETFALDPSKLPKEIDMVVTFLDQKHKPTIRPGIYSRNEERLTICINLMGKRPTDFKTVEGDGNVLTVYRRVESDPSVTLEFAQIQKDYSQANRARFDAMQKAKTVGERRKIDAEMASKSELFAERYLKFAEAHPDGFAGLVALCRAAFHAPASESGTKALALLKAGRVARADFGVLNLALSGSWTPSKVGQASLAPTVLSTVKQQLDHPAAAQLLTWVCANGIGQNASEPSATFVEAADLIVDRFAGSPDISNLCEIIAGAKSNRAWAGKAEKSLRTILDQNTHRMVRNRALFALASVVQGAGEARQDEAERLYHQFITEFNDPPKDNPDTVEQLLLTRAKAEIEEIGSRGLGKPAPELVGEDLAGKPMKLTDFRGKVVLVSFWATWCGPCMRMVPHEESLVERLKDKPFALVGVNGDIEPEELEKGIEKHGVTWRSFKNKQGDKTEISQEWKIPGWPTFYLIDREGIIRKRWTDTVPPDVLNREIDNLIEADVSKSAGRR
jgi:uncharacterized protein (TIGR03067 family)